MGEGATCQGSFCGPFTQWYSTVTLNLTSFPMTSKTVVLLTIVGGLLLAGFGALVFFRSQMGQETATSVSESLRGSGLGTCFTRGLQDVSFNACKLDIYSEVWCNKR